MSLIHYSAREINCKLVYYGPGLGGKTTNLRHIHARAPVDARGKLISISTDNDRTLFFDFLPLDIGSVRGFRVRFHLYTVPGQNIYAASRRLILRGVDGVVFVADSQAARLGENRASLADLEQNLASHAQDVPVPVVVQYNKRDLPDALPLAELQAKLNPGGLPSFEAVALRGTGVFETLKACGKEVFRALEVGRVEAGKARELGRQ